MRIHWSVGMTLLAASLAVPAAFAQTARPRARTVAAVSAPSYLGIGVQDIDAERAKALKLKEARGVEITNVYPDSPAAKAGLKDGDVVLDFNGQPVEGGQQLTRLVQETPVGRQVKIGVWRNGAMQTVTATMEERKGMAMPGGHWMMPEVRVPMPDIRVPEIEIPRFQMMYESRRLGIIGEALGQQEQLAEFFGVKEGVLVKSVSRNSAAEKAGIKAGDVITKIDNTSVNSSSDITRALRQTSKTSFNITLIRNRKEMTVPVTVEAASTGHGERARFFGPLIIRPAVVISPRVQVIVYD